MLPHRRAVLAGGAAAAALTATAAWSFTMSNDRQPVVFLPHGGGPWPWMNPDAFGPGAMEPLRRYLAALPGKLSRPPRAILMVSAHWEEPVPTVMTSAKPPMLFDYYGFPPETYQISWPAPGEPALAARVRELLGRAGFDSAANAERGYDHGTFVPMAVAWPKAEVPTVQLSLIAGLDPAQHVALGRALAPLRDEGVLIVASGMSYHNMRGFGSARGAQDSELFDAWLAETVQQPAAQRDARLAQWSSAPAGRACHPREEHLLPLMVAAGAAGDDVGSVPFTDRVLGTRVSAVHFG